MRGFIKGIMWLIGLSSLTMVVSAQAEISSICPQNPVQQRRAEFMPSGIILSAFDAENMWVYDIARDTRYPLPETRPCNATCHLSPDFMWFSYLNPDTGIAQKMRLNGTQRTPLVTGASDVAWWSDAILRVWTPDGRLYLQPEDDVNAVERLSSQTVRTLQPAGRHALVITEEDGIFWRELANLADMSQVYRLDRDAPYFNAAAWSPDGRYLAYAAGDALFGADLWIIAPDSAPQRLTNFAENGQPVRLNGYAPGDLSWSPDGTRIAFWAVELTGSDPVVNTGRAMLYLADVTSGTITSYCGFTTVEHTPVTPRLVWSPDGTHIAFAGNIPADNKGSLLLALNIQTGVFTELSDGLYPVFGIPQVVAWGLLP